MARIPSCVVILALSLFLPRGAEAQDSGPCDTIRCSDHGRCIRVNGFPFCQCDQGYITSSDHLACLPASLFPGQSAAPAGSVEANPCSTLRCPRNSSCSTREGTATCYCFEGFVPSSDGSGCIAPPAPAAATQEPGCSRVSCSGHGVCVMRGQVPTCACDEGYGTDIGGLSCVPAGRPGADPGGRRKPLPPKVIEPRDQARIQVLRHEVSAAKGATLGGFIFLGVAVSVGGLMASQGDTRVAGYVVLGAGGGAGLLMGVIGAALYGERKGRLRRLEENLGVGIGPPGLVLPRSLAVRTGLLENEARLVQSASRGLVLSYSRGF